MRTILLFTGLMICGMMLAAGYSSMFGPVLHTPAGKFRIGLDTMSFAAGLTTGLVLAGMTRIDWVVLPGRVIHWVMGNFDRVKLSGIAAVCLAVLLFY